MTEPSPPIRVVAAVVRRDGCYLLCRRPLHKRHGGLWEFPGGKLAEGETLGLAVGRELAEELGVEAVDVGRLLFEAADPGSPYRIEFVEVAISGEPRALEHDEIGWFAVQEMEALPLAPGDRRFLEEVLGGLEGRGWE